MSDGMEAVLTVLTGAATPLPMDATVPALVCRRHDRVLRVVLGSDPDGWTSGECPDCAAPPMHRQVVGVDPTRGG